MNTLKIEEALAKKYRYKKLPEDLSGKYRDFFTENIPNFLFPSGSRDTLCTLSGTPICNGYDRIVVGDYGAFIEFSQSDFSDSFIVQPGQEYRIDNERYSKNVKYIWLTVNDGSDIKIYLQKKGVTYADYKPGKYYVSVHEVTIGGDQS